ncbi:MAG: DUF512 domain-containing protein [Lachnospiraceae bacterium]|nr:DUF512 domain-containing protein [Lachnospiraceae bacterium]
MNTKGHLINSVSEGSIAEEMGVEAGDYLISINGNEIEDVFDYRFLVDDEYIEMVIRKADGEEWELEIEKDYDEEIGIEFENGLMDEYRRCHNKCIFCFIDQMPKGMRETLYFKDDDSRLSFLQGNYVTLTNMSDHDVERIIRYRLEPINISFQTTNPELRCKMLNNRFAGEALKKARKFYEAGITMNGQIVLCKGVNDGEELERSLRDLSEYMPYLQSLSVVPVGLSKHREGLYPLESFTKEDAREVLQCIHKWQKKMYEKYENHFVHAGDEWYILAEEDFPEEENYDGYLQYENGVGMVRSMLDMLQEELETHQGDERERELSMITGKLMYPFLGEMIKDINEKYPKVQVHLYGIRNDFFGEQITVAGLLTAQDIIAQVKDKPLGERLLLPDCMLRSGESVFLDDVTVEEMENALQVKIDIVKSSGQDFVEKVIE